MNTEQLKLKQLHECQKHQISNLKERYFSTYGIKAGIPLHLNILNTWQIRTVTVSLSIIIGSSK